MIDKQKQTAARPTLGKGLASLLPGAAPVAAPAATTGTPAVDSNKDRHLGISICSVDEIVANPYQPRRIFNDDSIAELAQSIKANGLIQPLIVRKAANGFQLIAGERRWRAAKLAGLKQVPIVIRRTTDKEALELAIIENIQREDLNCMDTALSYFQLINDFNLTQEVIAERVGKNRTTITNHLRLLKLPTFVQNVLKDGKLTFGHGRALAGLEDQTLSERLAKESIDKTWSVRELENQIQKINNLQKARENQLKDKGVILNPLELRLRNLGKELSQKFGTKVLCKGSDTKGKIVLEYFNADDLDKIITQLMK